MTYRKYNSNVFNGIGEETLQNIAPKIIGDSKEQKLKREEAEKKKDIDRAIEEAKEQEKKDMQAATKYNQNINEHSELVDKLMVADNKVLIRLFKYEYESNKTESGLIIESLEEVLTDGGQKRAKINTNPYQKRGVIVTKASNLNDSVFYMNLSRGTIVHISNNKLEPYHVDREKKVDMEHEGYFLVHVGIIESVENNNENGKEQTN